jgi:hypothetical protein
MSRSSKARRWTLERRLLKTVARCYWLGLVIYPALLSVGTSSKPAKADQLGSLGLPVSCALGTECFVQQMPDIDSSSGVLDPLCGVATYEGHDGWDIRSRSLRDIGQDVSVLAVGNGRVARVRDGIDDQIYVDARDKTRVADRECGNGVVIEHAWVWAINVEARIPISDQARGPRGSRFGGPHHKCARKTKSELFSLRREVDSGKKWQVQDIH